MHHAQPGVEKRLRELIARHGTTIGGFAELINFPKGTLEKYLNNKRLPNAELLLAISSRLGVSISWLLEGVGDQYIDDILESHATSGGDFPMLDTKDDYVEIQRFNVDASAGHGSAITLEEETGQYAFKKAWLDRRGLNSNNLSVISVAGDSMEPDLRDGDLILIDHATTSLADGNIYVVRFSDGIYVKRIQHLPGDKVHLISSNRNYPPIEIAHPVADGVEVVGRVVASMHEW